MRPSLLCSTLLLALRSRAQDPIRPYPLVDAELKSTSFLDHASYVQDLDDPQWYLDNIPFVDFPDKPVQDVYYYRTSVIKRHLKYAHEGHGWTFTEFIHPVTWASKFQTIPDSAGHHIVEARWLRDTNYAKDLILAYTRGGTEALNGVTYTHYVQRAIYEHAQVTGDKNFLTAQLEGMIRMFDLWDVQFDNTTGLYHRTPLSDAQEYSLPGYTVGGPNGGPVEQWDSFDNDYNTIWLGPETYRPSFNSYMVANARAIASVAALSGNDSLATAWTTRADDLEAKMTDLLWDQDINFWIDVVEGSNIPAVGRQLIGYYPYRFDVGTNSTFVRGLEAGLTPEAFLTDFGPTTLEQTNPYYTARKNNTNCCVWNGQSWPFSTSVYLNVLAKLVRTNESSVTKEFFNQEFDKYVRTNHRGGVPYTAESHYPTVDQWSGDTANHSEHYLHSTYLDNVFTNLLGIVPNLEDKLELRPLVPDNWTYFAVENLPYHGSLLSLLWDQTGTHYAASNTSGLSIYLDGQLIHTQPSLQALSIPLSNRSSAIAALAARPRHANILANPNTPWGFPAATSDYTWSPNGDVAAYPAWKLIDGLVWYDGTPDNRWTNNQSTTPTNTVNVTLARARALRSVSLAVHADDERDGGVRGGGVIACPAAVRVAALDGTVLAERNPWSDCRPNALNTLLFTAPANGTDASANDVPADGEGVLYITAGLSITLRNQLHYAVALSEVQVWVPETDNDEEEEGEQSRYELEDGLAGTFIGSFQGTASGLNSSVVDGGVALGTGAWVEVGGVVVPEAGTGSVRLTGRGPGEVGVRVNFAGEGNGTVVSFDEGGEGTQEKSVEVVWEKGRNVVTVWWVGGKPWVDAFVVE